MTKHRYVLGKVAFTQSKRRDCEAAITWELKDSGEFSMQAEIWNSRKTDLAIGGQCVDTVAAYFPNDKKAQRMVEVWRRWHLNHMRAGTPAQMAWLRQNLADEVDYSKMGYDSYYSFVKAQLKAAGLEPNLGYSYGSAWLKEELPSEVRAEIEEWSMQALKDNVDADTRRNREYLTNRLAGLLHGEKPNAADVRAIRADVDVLGSIGARAHKLAEQQCNESLPEGYVEAEEKKLAAEAAPILAKYGLKARISGDPRGYAFHLFREGLRGNTWGGDESGYGLN